MADDSEHFSIENRASALTPQQLRRIYCNHIQIRILRLAPTNYVLYRYCNCPFVKLCTRRTIEPALGGCTWELYLEAALDCVTGPHLRRNSPALETQLNSHLRRNRWQSGSQPGSQLGIQPGSSRGSSRGIHTRSHCEDYTRGHVQL
jgi:hypothetical protein